jgi:hypothetical protein
VEFWTICLVCLPGREREALAIQSKALKDFGPVQPLGIWVGGCYYVLDEHGSVHDKTGTYTKVAFLAAHRPPHGKTGKAAKQSHKKPVKHPGVSGQTKLPPESFRSG